MDPEARYLQAPTPEQLASFKVFPLILSLKKEVTVSTKFHVPHSNSQPFSEYNRYVKRLPLFLLYISENDNIQDGALSWE